MSGRAPSGFAVQNAMLALSQLRDRLLAVEPSLADDAFMLASMLEGEDADDHLATIDRVIRCAIEADALIDAVQTRQTDLAERKARFTRRRDVLRQTAFDALDALGMNRRETGDFTASLANRPPKVVVVDEAALPSAFIRTRTEPDKTAIAAALKAGETVAGAELGNGGRGISIRTR